jgi:DDE superfamily endonuclease
MSARQRRLEQLVLRIHTIQHRLADIEYENNDDMYNDEGDQLANYVQFLMYEYNNLRQRRYLDRGPYRWSRLLNFLEVMDHGSEEDLPWLKPMEFQQTYKMSREAFFMVVELIQDHPVFAKQERGPPQIPVEFQFLSLLKYLTSQGTAARNVDLRSHFRCGYGSNSVYRARCITAILAFKRQYITWPELHERQRISERMEEKFQIPCCVGIVDGTLFPLARRPSRQDFSDFSGREKGFQLSTIIVCDDNKLIRYHLSGFPGCTHDNRIFQHSMIASNPHTYLSQQNGEYLLGDSAFQNEWYMVTSFKAPPNAPLPPNRRMFNRILNRPWIIVEHTIGLLKNRFSWLHRIQSKLTDADRTLVQILRQIEVCIVLHNFCRDLAVEQDLIQHLLDDLPQDGEANNQAAPEPAAGQRRGDDQRRQEVMQAVLYE